MLYGIIATAIGLLFLNAIDQPKKRKSRVANVKRWNKKEDRKMY